MINEKKARLSGANIGTLEKHLSSIPGFFFAHLNCRLQDCSVWYELLPMCHVAQFFPLFLSYKRSRSERQSRLFLDGTAELSLGVGRWFESNRRHQSFQSFCPRLPTFAFRILRASVSPWWLLPLPIASSVSVPQCLRGEYWVLVVGATVLSPYVRLSL